MFLGIVFILINLILISVGYLTKDNSVDNKFIDFKTIVVGDIFGLSIINFSFGFLFNFSNINIYFLISSVTISLLITTLLHTSYKHDTKNNSNSGYINGEITLHGKLHLLYCFYQLLILSLLILFLVDQKFFSYTFLFGSIIYLTSVIWDVKNGVLFVK
jgi:hypothetical protein